MNIFRKNLVNQLESKLVSRLRALGFQSVGLNQSELSDREFVTAHPLGFHRRPSDGGYDLIDIQFDPRGDARFAINAAHVGPDGIRLPWGKIVDMEDAHATDSVSYVRLIDGPVWKRWFGARLFSKRSLSQAEEIVDRALEKFAEIEVWFQTGECGRHLEVEEVK